MTKLKFRQFLSFLCAYNRLYRNIKLLHYGSLSNVPEAARLSKMMNYKTQKFVPTAF